MLVAKFLHGPLDGREIPIEQVQYKIDIRGRKRPGSPKQDGIYYQATAYDPQVKIMEYKWGGWKSLMN